MAAIAVHDGPVLLDLDETLYLRNSTEDFIDTVRPTVAVLPLMGLLDILKPWRWTGGETTRDAWRVRLAMLFFPWAIEKWRGRTRGLGARFVNQPLVDVLRARSTPPIVATTGFLPIVTPLVAALGLPEAQVVGARHTTFEDRRGGKLRLAVGALGEDTIRRALVITDAIADLPLLEACARPLRTVWPEATYRRAFSDVYRPGQYLTLVKRPGERKVIRGILQEDFAFWVLGSIALAPAPALHVLGLLFLLLSFWTVYEQGYVDNDRVAARLERDPNLSAAFHDSPVATPRLAPLLWALASGVIGVGVLQGTGPGLIARCAGWFAVLLATYTFFRIYNRFDKVTRVWLYPFLQFARSAAFVAVVPVTPIGAVAVGAHVLARWVPYYAYRLTGQGWRQTGILLARLQFFVVLAILFAIAGGLPLVLNGTALALLGWNVFRARRELSAALASATLLAR